MRSVNPSHRPARSWLTLLLTLLGFATLGCGNALYGIAAESAAGKLKEARELGAERYAAYEYFYAEEHLQKAQSEAAEADYSDARELAEASAAYAAQAIRLTRQAQRGAGR